MNVYLAGLAALCFGVGAASAQTSNSLAPEKSYGETDFSAVMELGFKPFTPDALTGYLAKRNFQIAPIEAVPPGEDIFIVAVGHNAIPYVFKLSQCGKQGCLFLEMIAPVLDEVMASPISGADRNDFNRINPMIILTSEEGGRSALRYKFPALQQCDNDCQNSALDLFVRLVNFSYIAFDKISKSRVEANASGDFAPTLASVVTTSAVALASSGHRELEARALTSAQFATEAGLRFANDEKHGLDVRAEQKIDFPQLMTPRR